MAKTKVAHFMVLKLTLHSEVWRLSVNNNFIQLTSIASNWINKRYKFKQKLAVFNINIAKKLSA